MMEEKKEEQEIIILTSKGCSGCSLIEELLKDKPNVKFVDLDSEGGEQYWTKDEIPVPSAYVDGEHCSFEFKDDGIHLSCKEKIIPLCKVKTENDQTLIDCGQGWRALD